MPRPRSERAVTSARCTVTEHKGRTLKPHWATRGLTKCRMHGGRVEKGQAVVDEQRAQIALAKARERAGEFLMKHSVVVVRDPIAELLHQITNSARLATAYELLIDDAGEIVQQTEQGGKTWEKPHVYIELYNGERDRLVNFITSAAKLGLAERMVRLHEERGEDEARRFLASLDTPAAALTEEQKRALRKDYAARLRAVAAEQPALG